MKKLMKIIEKILFKITKITKMAKINQNKMLKKMLQIISLNYFIIINIYI